MAIYGKCGKCIHCLSDATNPEAALSIANAIEKNPQIKPEEKEKRKEIAVKNTLTIKCSACNKMCRPEDNCRCGKFELNKNVATPQEIQRYEKLVALEKKSEAAENALGQPKSRPEGTFLDKLLAMISKDIREASVEAEFDASAFEKAAAAVESVISQGGAAHPTYYQFVKNVELREDGSRFYRFGVGGFYNPIAGEVVIEASVIQGDKTYLTLSAKSEGKFDCLKFLQKGVLAKIEKAIQ